MAPYRPTDYEIMQYLSHHHYHFSAKTHEATGRQKSWQFPAGYQA